RLTDALQGIKPLKAMGLESNLRPLLEQETEGLNRALQRQVLSKWYLTVSQEPVMGVFLALGLYVALTAWALPMSVLLVTAVLFTRTVSRIGSLQKARQNIAVLESAFWSLREAIEEARRQREQTPSGPVPELCREVSLEQVSFGYDPQRPLLRDADLVIPAGSFTGLIGPSGAGKTTVADLIAGLQRPDRGRVLIDGRPLEEYDIHGWRSRIGYVPQELILFHDTVRRNITLGDPALDDGRIWQALEEAGAREFVEGLASGLDTVIGERGIRLSGGQRQRLAIARALVRRPRLLILDEATTALDPATEAAVCRTLRALAPAVTVLAISHQPRLVESADRLYRIEDGVLSEVSPAHPQHHALKGNAK
ncbi:MAG: ATP-binding cassette domain-containing protein, partial [Gammaproteobacteria bacterium]